MKENKLVGLTKDVGWEIGVRKTMAVSANIAWDFLFSDNGIKSWLGEVKSEELRDGESYKTRNGTKGVVRIFKPYSHIRMTWKRKNWENTSTLQIRIIPLKDSATISFHQEKLADNEQREDMKQHWESVIKDIEKALKK